jgi:hypothetical protein
MDEQRGRAVVGGEPIACGLSRREQFAVFDVEAELGKTSQHLALRHAGRVGDEAQGQTRLAQALDCRKSAGQRMIAVVDHAGEVEQGALDHGFKFERRTGAGQRRPVRATARRSAGRTVRHAEAGAPACRVEACGLAGGFRGLAPCAEPAWLCA